MNLQIDIQQITTTQDGYGDTIKTPSNLYTGLWASMITTGGGEFYAAQKLNAATTAVFKTRYVEGVKSDMKVIYGSRTFEILFVNNKDEKFEWLLLSCKEVV